MTCDVHDLGNGQRAIVCSRERRKCCACGTAATLACDWKVPSRRSGTCDAPICRRCATSPAPEKDICPDHAPALHAWLERRRAKTERIAS